jgi:hypothetical protein
VQLGGAQDATALAVDQSGNIYLAGYVLGSCGRGCNGPFCGHRLFSSRESNSRILAISAEMWPWAVNQTCRRTRSGSYSCAPGSGSTCLPSGASR